MWSVTDKIFCYIGSFLALLPPNNPENQNFEKMKKILGDIILHVYHKWKSYMMYGSWDMECDRQNFFSFWTIFCPFTPPPLITWKIKILKKWKKTPGDNIILHKCIINDNHMMHGSWDLKCDRQNFLSFWSTFCPFTPLTAWKTKI